MLCKCSGKYIDIYFILKITFYLILILLMQLLLVGNVRFPSELQFPIFLLYFSNLYRKRKKKKKKNSIYIILAN